MNQATAGYLNCSGPKNNKLFYCRYWSRELVIGNSEASSIQKAIPIRSSDHCIVKVSRKARSNKFHAAHASLRVKLQQSNTPQTV